jgi:hypothetical protein
LGVSIARTRLPGPEALPGTALPSTLNLSVRFSYTIRPPVISSASVAPRKRRKTAFANELHRVGAAIVFNQLAFTFDEFIEAFTLLPEKSRFLWRSGYHAELVAIRVLAHINADLHG